MSPDDPRHGEVRGYRAHRRDDEAACADCLRAIGRYKKRRALDSLAGLDRLVPKWRLRRRVEALQRIGYSLTAINDAADLGHRWLHTTLHMPGDMVTARSLAKVDVAYRRMQGTPGPSDRARQLAARRGYPSPLAWDDIDDIDEVPNFGGRDDELDPVVVDRLLSGRRIPSTQAEKLEAMRRWLARGGSEKSLCDAHGWKYGRYITREAGAA